MRRGVTPEYITPMLEVEFLDDIRTEIDFGVQYSTTADNSNDDGDTIPGG